MSEKYTIKTLDDFCDVPCNRLESCLDEFMDWINVMNMAKQVVGNLGLPSVDINTIGFIWTDDGERKMNGVDVEFETVKEK